MERKSTITHHWINEIMHSEKHCHAIAKTIQIEIIPWENVVEMIIRNVADDTVMFSCLWTH